MPKKDDEPKRSTARKRPATAKQALIAERAWARALARQVANQLPEAARKTPNLRLTADQLEQLRKVFENTLISNMGGTSRK
jgi:hypothetical protein